MNSGISIKVIFFSFLFINFIQQGKTAEVYKSFKRENNLFLNEVFSKKLRQKIPPTFSINNNFKKISIDGESFEKNFPSLLANNFEKKKELVIQSDKQSEINNVIYAEGNVSVTYGGKFLKSDILIYDKLNKKISAEGNVSLIIGDQIFKVSKLEYNFSSEKGYLLDVKGSINFNNFIDDLSSNFSFSDFNKIEKLLEFKKKEALYTPGKVDNWVFFYR